MKPVVRNIKQQGLTLLELMVVLAIIGILATIGATQLQNYIARTRTAEGLTLAAPYKLAVEEAITTGNGVFTQTQLALPPFTATQDVTNIGVSDMTARGVGGVITITFGARIGDQAGRTLTLTPWVNNGGIQWQCAADKVPARTPENAQIVNNTGFVAGSLEAKLAPANCRG